MDAAKLTGVVTIPIDSTSISTDELIVDQGTVTDPSIKWKGDLMTGIYSDYPGSLTFALNGTNALSMYASDAIYCRLLFLALGGLDVTDDLTMHGGNIYVLAPGVVSIDGGSVSNPSISLSGTANGLYYSATDTVSITSNGVETLRMKYDLITALTAFLANSNVTVNGNLIISAGSSSAPSLYFSGDATTGIYKNGASTLSITSSSTEVARFNVTLIQFFKNITMGTNTINCGDITTTGIILSSGTAKGGLYLSGTKVVTSTSAMTNGQLMIGSTAGVPASANLTGTTNQINITNGSNTITLATPQDIATTSTPTFGGGFINGAFVVGKASPALTTASNKLQLYGYRIAS